MPTFNESILVVDDAKFSSTLIARKLMSAGYSDVRVANHAHDALALVKERPAAVLLADWLMPDMDGIDLCKNIIELDQQKGRLTYCILITAKDSPDALSFAFEQGVDDFILKADLNQQLLPRVSAAARNSLKQNKALEERNQATRQLNELQACQRLDQTTGLGNIHQARDMLDRVLQHSDARGGATSFMTVQINNWDQIEKENKPLIRDELCIQFARKLRSLVRPLDEICKINDYEYAIIAHFADASNCNLGTYRRVSKGLDHQSFRTTSGFITVNVSCATCFVEDSFRDASFEKLNRFNEAQLQQATEDKKLLVSAFSASA
jgi:PleD family two-component response regulator